MSMGHFHVGHVWIRYLGVVNFGLGWYLLLLRVPWLPKGGTETYLPQFGKVLVVTSKGLPLECHVLTWGKLLTTTT